MNFNDKKKQAPFHHSKMIYRFNRPTYFTQLGPDMSKRAPKGNLKYLRLMCTKVRLFAPAPAERGRLAVADKGFITQTTHAFKTQHAHVPV